MRKLLAIASGLLFYSQAICSAHGATLTRDYTVDVQPSDIKLYYDGSSYVTKYVTDSEWITIQQGDTLSGTIRFADNLSFSTLYEASINTTFSFFTNLGSPAIAYSTVEETMLLSNKAEQSSVRISRSYCSYICYSLSPYSKQAEKMTNISGLEYKINFVRLEDLNKKPIRIRLSRIQATRIAGLAAPVPEPSTWAMMMLGMAGIGLTMRRHRTTAKVTLA